MVTTSGVRIEELGVVREPTSVCRRSLMTSAWGSLPSCGRISQADKTAVEVRVEGRAVSPRLLPSTRTLDLDSRKPGFQILLKTFLRFQVCRDDDKRALRKKFLKQRGEERVGRPGRLRRKTALRHSPVAGQGTARREIARCQRTNCLSPTLSRFAASGKSSQRYAAVKLWKFSERTFWRARLRRIGSRGRSPTESRKTCQDQIFRSSYSDAFRW